MDMSSSCQLYKYGGNTRSAKIMEHSSATLFPLSTVADNLCPGLVRDNTILAK